MDIKNDIDRLARAQAKLAMEITKDLNRTDLSLKIKKKLRKLLKELI